jgi:V/A-type H+/Na+-transporting ATPase subunit A
MSQVTAKGTPTARIVAVQEDIVRIEIDPTIEDSQLVKNEVIYILPTRANPLGYQERLQAEVLRVRGNMADAQVFESTAAVGIGDPVEQTGQMLGVQLGPGLLGSVYDGLQNPLEQLAQAHGFFLPRGYKVAGLDPNTKWSFTAVARSGARLSGGDVLGTVEEGVITHKIMLPFDIDQTVELIWIQDGTFTVQEPIARVRDANGEERAITMAQNWPVRRAVPERLLQRRRNERLYPTEPMITTIRLIDTFFPIAQGGMGCIPGPFGAGKTVLQNLIVRHADVDVVIVVACGERAGEVVETITELPQLKDPKTGGSLMDRTVIICNTSSMPVASREASIYTGITLGEYYRQMGLKVFLIADSTSRWAQAMRETSGRLEEIPGEEAYPAYLDSAIKGVYERAGVIRTNDGSVGSLTMMGTVSPAGGNFEEPVTQSTLGTVKTFLGLSADRAYKRFYPAVDPLLSWSRYFDQMAPWYAENLGAQWLKRVEAMVEILRRGDQVEQMMQVTGEEGVTMADFIVREKARFLDMVYLQQDAFDAVDVSVPLDRQKVLFDRICRLIERDYAFADKAAAQRHFTRLTGLFKNLNYAPMGSPEYKSRWDEIEKLDAAVPAERTAVAEEG